MYNIGLVSSNMMLNSSFTIIFIEIFKGKHDMGNLVVI
jgi:hypothetical protein